MCVCSLKVCQPNSKHWTAVELILSSFFGSIDRQEILSVYSVVMPTHIEDKVCYLGHLIRGCQKVRHLQKVHVWKLLHTLKNAWQSSSFVTAANSWCQFTICCPYSSAGHLLSTPDQIFVLNIILLHKLPSRFEPVHLRHLHLTVM